MCLGILDAALAKARRIDESVLTQPFALFRRDTAVCLLWSICGHLFILWLFGGPFLLDEVLIWMEFLLHSDKLAFL